EGSVAGTNSGFASGFPPCTLACSMNLGSLPSPSRFSTRAVSPPPSAASKAARKPSSRSAIVALLHDVAGLVAHLGGLDHEPLAELASLVERGQQRLKRLVDLVHFAVSFLSLVSGRSDAPRIASGRSTIFDP